MLWTAFSLGNSNNWFIPDWTVHVDKWAGVAVTFFKNNKMA